MPGARPFLALVGPTASGKSEAAMALTRRLGAEIVSVDSMLVYRGMDVGTAKPTAAERTGISHHLVDVAEPEEPFSVARYQQLARAVVESVDARGRRVLLVGGSGLYFRAIVDELEFPATDPEARDELRAEAEALGPDRLHRRLAELDPAAAARIEPTNVRRTVRALEVAAVTGRPFSSYAVRWERYPDERVRAAGIDIPRDVLARRIEARVRAMVDAGLLDEVRALLDRGLFGWLTASRAIGYAEFAGYLRGEITLADATAETVRRTRELARRQMVWFRRDPRIRWFPAGEGGAIGVVDEVTEYLQGD
ncbi:MAG TPA: tRNA (adenosine(37)-N6)-dimethylallyltransferase MiaA [Actinomycetota bacterium]|jgi:tRNA dimethylallyltransferase|nr:tRNA (adenosine(37)-N6)-dimethylallyltransferase MiaA [Actinomycetota bacterium]